MLVTIQQIKSNFENLFEASSDGRILFYAKTPWMKAFLPFDAENLQELVFFNAAGEPLYTARRRVPGNAGEGAVPGNAGEDAVPFQYPPAGERRFGQFEMIGENGVEGTFYALQNGVADGKFCIEHRGKVFLGYSLDRGRNNYASIYDGEKQIAQITKPLTVVDNLDVYFLHVKEEYAPAVPILSFFTVYYDYRKYNNSGELTKKSVEFVTSYTFGGNSGKYNPNWIAEEFGRQVSDEFKQILEKRMEQSSAQAKKIVKMVGLIFLAAVLLALILLVILTSVFGR